MPKAVKPHYYRVRSGKGPNDFLVSKLNEDFELVASYGIYPSFDGSLTCNCPSRKRPCKHISILHTCQDFGKVDGPELFNAVTGRFVSIENV